MEAAVDGIASGAKKERRNEIMTRKNFKNANEQLVLFTESELAAVSDGRDSRREKHTARRVSSRKGGSRPSGCFRNPFDSFDANRYHTAGADVEANEDIGYGGERHSGTCSDNRHIMRYRFHNFFVDEGSALPDECDSASWKLPDYILGELLIMQKCGSNGTETGGAHRNLQKYTNARMNPKDEDGSSRSE